MSSLDDPTMKRKYQKCKLRVKKWESDFMEKYGRKPSKNDIKDADSTIKESYKMYWKLKTKVLEETLLDITFSDDLQFNTSINCSINDLSTSEILLNTSINSKNFIKESVKDSTIVSIPDINEISITNTENIAPPNRKNSSPSSREYSSVSPMKSDCTNVEGAWGDHLNKDKEAPQSKQRNSISRSTSFQLSQKKFTSSSFTKRNPRKSLSMLRSKSKTDVSNSSSQLEINKCEAEDNIIVPDSMSLILNDEIKVKNQEQKITTQAINPILDAPSGKGFMINRKLDPDWINRCAKDTDYEIVPGNSNRLSGVSDSGIESIGANSHETQENLGRNCDNASGRAHDEVSDDDFVCNSDTDEEDKGHKRIRNWKRMLSDLSLQQAKRPRLDISDDNVDNFSSTIQSNKSLSALTNDAQVCNSFTKDNENLSTLNQKKEMEAKIKQYDFVEENKLVGKKVMKDSYEKLIKRKVNVDVRTDDVVVLDDTEKQETSRNKQVNSKKTGGRVTKRRSNKDENEKVKKKRVTRRKKAKSSEDEEKDSVVDPQHSEVSSKPSEIPIFGVESLNVVPRFSVPQNTKGDLIDEFCESINVDKSTNDSQVSKTNTKSKTLMSAKERLEAKVAAGKVNENFVRINLKKKVFVRGKRSFNFSKYKKMQWKNKKKELASGEGSLDLADLAEKNTCFKCGGSNHISRKCPAMKSDELLPLKEDELNASEFPSLEEAKKMANEHALSSHSGRSNIRGECSSSAPITEGEMSDEDVDVPDNLFDDDFQDVDGDDLPPSNIVGHSIPKELIDKLLPPINGVIDPIYQAHDSSKLIDTPKEVFNALKMFGHTAFRPGQEKAVMRILSGQSTLVTLSTGSGKSLCYQLPAYLYAKRSHCITLVISPLVSLMDDQVTGVPDFISAAALHTGQTPKVREKIIDTIKNGKIDILLVSPEAVVAGEKSTGFGSLLRQLPPIAFACIDEAHCISQWSHNFRPSYLMVCRVLIEKLGVKTILGLTATATVSTAKSIVEHLKIHDGLEGVISDIPVPTNLTLTVSKDDLRDRALVDLLMSSRFEKCDSIIVYCTKRDECVRIAGLLRVAIKETVGNEANKPKSKAKVSPVAEAYHAGLPASRRKVIQKAFMNGTTRIVVATVAFGMGINKSNIRAVIHFNMPRSFEGYVQEVGRAGRDNLPAHCHLFMSAKENQDKWELRRHIYSDGVDRHTIRKLLQKIFIPCSCAANKKSRCPGHEVAIPVDETVKALDVSEETISTLLCYLELHPNKFITVLSSVYVNARVSSYNGPKALKVATQKSPPLAMAIALDKKKGILHENDSVLEFPVIDVAAAIGWDSGVVKSHLKNLEWENINGKPKRSAISVKFDTLGLRVRAPGDLTDTELDEALDALAERAQSQQVASLQQLDVIDAVLNKYSYGNVRSCQELGSDNVQRSECLKNLIRSYFQSDSPLSILQVPPEKSDKIVSESQVTSDIRSLICSYRDNNFSGRAIARIFHGIQSPNYSALTWSRCKFWRSYLGVDFNWIVQVATREILAMR